MNMRQTELKKRCRAVRILLAVILTVLCMAACVLGILLAEDAPWFWSAMAGFITAACFWLNYIYVNELDYLKDQIAQDTDMMWSSR